jgi:hypothetical protein
VQVAIESEAAGPAEVWGPDLRDARPVSDLIAELEGHGDLQLYALTFLLAARESGLCLTVGCSDAGDERLAVFIPCDSQEHGRDERSKALISSLTAQPGRSAAVLRLIKFLMRDA